MGDLSRTNPGRALATQLGTDAKMRKVLFSELDRAQRCHHLEYEKHKWVGFSGRNEKQKHQLFRVVKINKAVKWGSFSDNIVKKGFFSQKLRTHCLGYFRRSFVQASVPSVGSSPPPPTHTHPTHPNGSTN